jgi:4-carboxymuconolactone decarboxylase
MSKPMDKLRERDEAGRATMTKLFGRVPDRGYIPEEFFEKTVRDVYGELWNAPGLSHEERSLVTVTMLASQGTAFELELHLKGAKRLGISQIKAEALMAHIAHYCGWPTALQGFKAIERVYRERD